MVVLIYKFSVREKLHWEQNLIKWKQLETMCEYSGLIRRVKLTSTRLEHSISAIQKLYNIIMADTLEHISVCIFSIDFFIRAVTAFWMIRHLSGFVIADLINRVVHFVQIFVWNECFLAEKKIELAEIIHQMADTTNKRDDEIACVYDHKLSRSTATMVSKKNENVSTVNIVRIFSIEFVVDEFFADKSKTKISNNLFSANGYANTSSCSGSRRNFGNHFNCYLSGMWCTDVNWWSELMLNGFFREIVYSDDRSIIVSKISKIFNTISIV